MEQYKNLSWIELRDTISQFFMGRVSDDRDIKILFLTQEAYDNFQKAVRIEADKLLNKFTMEDIQAKVRLIDRTLELKHLLNDDAHLVNKIRVYIDQQVTNAYIAGANKLDLTIQPLKGITDTGEVAVKAINYSKDKGFRL